MSVDNEVVTVNLWAPFQTKANPLVLHQSHHLHNETVPSPGSARTALE